MSFKLSYLKVKILEYEYRYGCCSRWAIAEKIGGYLLSRPDLIQDMIHQLRNRISDESFTKSIKIRLDADLRYTSPLN